MIELLERYGGKSNAAMAGLYRRTELATKMLAEQRRCRLPEAISVESRGRATLRGGGLRRRSGDRADGAASAWTGRATIRAGAAS